MRTFWMRLFAAANATELIVFVYFLNAFILPNLSNPEVAGFLAAFAVFITLFVVVTAAAIAWPGAPRRRWFWLVGALPALAVLLLFAPQITYDITHPSAPGSYISTLLATTASVASIVAGVIAFRQVGQASAGRPGETAPRTRLAVTAVAGAIVGASLTAMAAGAAAGGGGSVAEAPTTTATIEAKDTKFVQTSLSMKNGEVLGIFVINRDSVGHSFDIDALGVHLQLSANSTTAVAIKPTAAGKLEFYCAVPGHRASGMAGTIDVQ